MAATLHVAVKLQPNSFSPSSYSTEPNAFTTSMGSLSLYRARSSSQKVTANRFDQDQLFRQLAATGVIGHLKDDSISGLRSLVGSETHLFRHLVQPLTLSVTTLNESGWAMSQYVEKVFGEKCFFQAFVFEDANNVGTHSSENSLELPRRKPNF